MEYFHESYTQKYVILRISNYNLSRFTKNEKVSITNELANITLGNIRILTSTQNNSS
jgi:hypothetical protein